MDFKKSFLSLLLSKQFVRGQVWKLVWILGSEKWHFFRLNFRQDLDILNSASRKLQCWSTTWKLTLQDINTTPAELKTERYCSHRQLFLPLWGTLVWRNNQRKLWWKISAHSYLSPDLELSTPTESRHTTCHLWGKSPSVKLQSFVVKIWRIGWHTLNTNSQGYLPGRAFALSYGNIKKPTFSAISVLYDKITVSWLLGIFIHL